jgi:DNA-binding LytR/AlgR family response regulator
MNIIIDESLEYEDIEIVIKCNHIDESLQELIKQINAFGQSIPCRDGRNFYPLSAGQVYYFETVDDKLFAYCHDEVHECRVRLHEVEMQLEDSKFVRVTKSSILNLKYLKKVRPLLNGKYEANLKNGEKLIISRNYVVNVKKKIGIT